MLCDLSLEALFKFSRSKSGRTVPNLSIPGLTVEHLTPLIAAGMLLPARVTDAHGAAKSTTKYTITEAGESHLRHLVDHTRLRLAAF